MYIITVYLVEIFSHGVKLTFKLVRSRRAFSGLTDFHSENIPPSDNAFDLKQAL